MTAELAVTLPVVVVILMLCLAGIQLVARQVLFADAAADAARALARGETSATAMAIAEHTAGSVNFSSSENGEFICVKLTGFGSGAFTAVQLAASSCALAGGK